jgi:hypothetical protein
MIIFSMITSSENNKMFLNLNVSISGYLKREAKAVAYWMHRDQRVNIK